MIVANNNNSHGEQKSIVFIDPRNGIRPSSKIWKFVNVLRGLSSPEKSLGSRFTKQINEIIILENVFNSNSWHALNPMDGKHRVRILLGKLCVCVLISWI